MLGGIVKEVEAGKHSGIPVRGVRSPSVESLGDDVSGWTRMLLDCLPSRVTEANSPLYKSLTSPANRLRD